MKADLKQATANELWLNYFNQYLFEKNVITETQRNKMKNSIALKCRAKNTKIFKNYKHFSCISKSSVV